MQTIKGNNKSKSRNSMENHNSQPKEPVPNNTATVPIEHSQPNKVESQEKIPPPNQNISPNPKLGIAENTTIPSGKLQEQGVLPSNISSNQTPQIKEEPLETKKQADTTSKSVPVEISMPQQIGNNETIRNLDSKGMMPGHDQMLFQGSVVLNQYNSIAEYLAAKGDFANALKYYEKITVIDPENGAGWTALGHCYLLTDDLQKAFTSYQKALYSLPDVRDPQLWYGIGLLYDKVIIII